MIHDKAIEELLRELMGEPETGKPFVFMEGLVKNYLQDLNGRAGLLSGSGEKSEGLMYYLQEAGGSIKAMEAFVKSPEFSDSLYKKSYERLKALGDESKSYVDLYTEIYEDETYLNEIFVRLVEETEGVAITSTKQLQELTGITEIYGYWDEEKRETVPYGDKKPTKKEAQETALNQVGDTFIKAMSYRYSKALKDILEAGGKYSDLLQVKPSYFNLPETWRGCLASDRDSSILWAIEETFLIGEGNTVKPELKAIAREIEAPYSILMEAHRVVNGNTNPEGGNLQRREDKIKSEIRAKLPEVISKMPKQWKEDRGLFNPKQEGYSNVYKNFESWVILAINVLVTGILAKTLGKKEEAIVNYSEEAIDFIKKHFKEEIQAQANITIHKGLGGHKIAETFKTKVKNGIDGD